MTPDDKKFNVTVWLWLSWEGKKVQILDDHDLIIQLHKHHNMLYYYMQLYLNERPSAIESTTKIVLFQTFIAPETSILVTTEKSNFILDTPFTNTNDKKSFIPNFFCS